MNSHPMCDARLLDGSRVNVAVRAGGDRRAAGVDPQILQEAVQPRTSWSTSARCGPQMAELLGGGGRRRASR